MSRSVKEWIGRTDDSRPPPRVRLRVLERWGRKCHISGQPIRAGDNWATDHDIAIINGGLNCESNLRPVLVGPHKEKTIRDLKEKSKIYRIKAKHYGIKKTTGFQTNRSGKWKKKMNGQCIPRVKA